MKLFVVARVIAGILLLIALDRLPYDFYTLLRFVVCGVTAYGAYLALELKRKEWMWSFGIVAVLFNPIVPIHLRKDTWAFIDVGVAIFLFVSIFLFKDKKTSEKE